MLTETRKADRRKMADIVEQIAAEFGATTRERTEDGIWPNSVGLEIVGPRHTTVGMRFHRERIHETNNIWVLTWNSAQGVCFADAFSFNLNRYHFGKATDIAYGFDHLCQLLRLRLGQMNDGSAFDDVRAAEYQAKTDRGEQLWQRLANSGPLLPKSPENGQPEPTC